MDTATALFSAVAAISLSYWFVRRSARRASALSSAGLGRETAPARARRPRRIPALDTLLEHLGRRFSPHPGEEICRLLGGCGSAWSPHYLQGLRLAAGLAAAASVLPLGLAALPLAPVLFAAGRHVPVIALKRRLSRRLDGLARDLPEVVDLMAVLCFSGESLSRALNHSVSICTQASAREEMEGILERIRLGESAAESLRAASSHPCREMRRFCRTLLRAEEFGAPVAETLEDLAVELRSGRRERERIRASRVSVLILLPLVFLILPSFLLLTVGGMILGYTL